MKKQDFDVTKKKSGDDLDAEESAALRSRLADIKEKVMSWKDLPDSMKQDIFRHFLEFQQNQPQARETECDIAVDLVGLKLAVKDSDLNFVEALAASSLAITTYLTTVAGANPEVTAVSLIFSAFALYRRLIKKVVVLNNEQYKILMALKASGPATVDQLSDNLSGLHLFGSGVWTTETTLKALQGMEAIHLRDGTVEALVSKASDGRWAANGI